MKGVNKAGNLIETTIKKIVVIIIAFVISHSSFSQTKFTLSGYAKDSLSSETIIGASLSVNGHGKGVISNQYGFYSITLPAGDYDFSISHVGYNTQKIFVRLNQNTSLDFLLIPKSTTFAEVIVSSKRRDANVKNAQMGKFDLSMSQ